MKPYTKELLHSALKHFCWAFPLLICVDLVVHGEMSEQPLYSYTLGALIFSVLSTLFKYLEDRRKNRTRN